MAGNNILTTLTISPQHGRKVALIFRTGSHLVLHPIGHSIRNGLDFFRVTDDHIIHALGISGGGSVTSHIQKALNLLISGRLGLKIAHAATHTQKLIGRLRIQGRHGHRTLLCQGRILIIQGTHGANSHALTTAHASPIKMALGTVLAQGKNAGGTAFHANTTMQAFTSIDS